MAAFGAYAQFYDALYQDKDYAAECDFLEQIFTCYAQAPIRTILDLGCGTGGHALPLAQRGYEVTGIDRSERMLVAAQAKTSSMEHSNVPTFQRGDIRDLDLGQTFDAVIAMFAVISYQTTTKDLVAAFRTARRHLALGGLFVFDCWFGPAVLTQRPTDRYKVVEGDGERIIRFASPTLDVLRHTVRVDYKVLRLKGNQVVDELDEAHPMRYLFPQETAYFLKTNGFKVVHMCPFMKLACPLTDREWNMTVVAMAVEWLPIGASKRDDYERVGLDT